MPTICGSAERILAQKALGDHDRRSGLRFIIAGGKQPSHDRTGAGQLKEFVGYDTGACEHCLTTARKRQIRFFEAGHRLERVILHPPVFEIDPGYADAARLRGGLAEPRQTLTRRERQRLEKNGIHRAEDSGVSADSDSQRQNHDERKDTRFPDPSRRVTKVLKERFECRELPRLIASLARRSCIAKLALRDSHPPLQASYPVADSRQSGTEDGRLSPARARRRGCVFFQARVPTLTTIEALTHPFRCQNSRHCISESLPLRGRS